MEFHKLTHAVQHSDINWFVIDDNLSKCTRTFHKKTGDGVLHLVCRFGRRDLLDLLLECDGVNLEIANYEGKKPLHEAAQYGQLDCVEFLLQNGVKVDCLKRADWTPLMLACTKCHLPVISVLLKHGADPALVNKDGWNSFHIAAREGSVQVLQALLAENSSLWNTVSRIQRTPLHTAALHGQEAAVRFLLTSGHCDYPADPRDSCGVTPLMDCLTGGFICIARLLIEHKADVYTRDLMGMQAVHHAAQAGQVEAVDFLVSSCGVPVNTITTTSNLTTPLHLAAKEGKDDVIKLLIVKGADVNQKDSRGRTALHIAQGARHASTVEVLLDCGADDTGQ